MSNKDDSDDGNSPRGAGWSGVLLDRSSKVLDSLYGGPEVPFADSLAWDDEKNASAKQSSPNHEATAWNCEALRAAINGTPQEKANAYRVLNSEYYPREIGPGSKHIGIWTSETLCPDNHTHQHLSGVGMNRAAAIKSQDATLLDRSAELLRANVGMLLALSTPGTYYISSVGVRCHGKPMWWWGTAWLRQVMRMKPIQDKFSEELYRDRAAVGIRAIRWCQEQKIGTSLLPKDPVLAEISKLSNPFDYKPYPLKYEVNVYRGKSSHLVIMPRPKDGHEKSIPKDVCDWVSVPWGLKSYKATMAQVEFGLDWKTPPPEPPAGAELITFPAAHNKEEER